MPPRYDEPFPFLAVRDLLGVLRALWLSTAEDHIERRRRIEALASELRGAYAMAKRTDPGTMGQRAAWKRAEEAVGRLGGLVDCLMPLEPLVRAAGDRVVGEAAVRPRRKVQDPRR